MSALKGRAVERFLARPDLDRGFVLIYGPDAGLVSENGARLARTWLGPDPDPESLLVFDAAELDADPQRLGVAVRSPSLFGTGRVIRVRGAGNKLAATLAELLGEQLEASVIVEAGDLKPRDALRKLAEERENARALPCYADSAQDIDQLIRETFAAESVSFSPDLVPFLRDLLGNDRQVTRRELEKLVLYAKSDGAIDRDAVLALCGDNAALAIDSVLDAVGTGHARKFDDALGRAGASGTDPQRLLIACLGHFQRLRSLRAQMEAGASPDEVLRRATPRIHFSRTTAMQQQLRLWNDDALASATDRLYRAIADSRRQQALSPAIARQAMLAVCMAAARR